MILFNMYNNIYILQKNEMIMRFGYIQPLSVYEVGSDRINQIWNDRGSGADHDVSFNRVQTPEGELEWNKWGQFCIKPYLPLDQTKNLLVGQYHIGSS